MPAKDRFLVFLPDNGQDYCGLFFCLMLSIFSCRKFLQNAAVFLGIPLFEYSVFLYYALVLFVFYKSLPEIRKRLNKLDAFLFLFLSLSFISSVLFFDSDPVLKADIFRRYFAVCCLSYFSARALELTEKNIKYMRLFAYLIMTNELIQLFVFRLYPFSHNTAFLMLGRTMLTIFILLIMSIVRDLRASDCIVWILALFIIIASGSRVAFIIILATTAVAILYGSRSKRAIAMLFSVYLGAVAVFFAWKDKILATLYELYFTMGFSCKFFILSARDNFINNRTAEKRRIIWHWCSDFISNHIFVGSGIINERFFINDVVPFRTGVPGAYPHNFFLEICTQFGLIPGMLILLAGAIVLIGSFVRSHSYVDRLFIIILLMTSLGGLMISSSYIQDALFYTFAGFLIQIYSKKSDGYKHCRTY